MFLVLRFTEEDDDVAVVPSLWYEDGICMWPPTKDVESFARKSKKPDSTWQKCPATLIRCFGTYDEARKKLPRAEFVSDLESPSEPERRNTSTKRYIDSTPHSPKRTPKKKKICPPPRLQLVCEDEQREENAPKCNNTNSSKGGTDSILLQDPNSTGEDSVIPTENPVELQIEVPADTSRLESLEFMCNAILENQKTIITQLVTLQTAVDMYTESSSRQLNNLSFATQPEEPQKLISNPFHDNIDFNSFDTSLVESTEKRDKLVKEFKFLRGGTPMEFVKRIMSRVLTEDLALRFSLTGQKGNLDFHSTTVYLCILEAVVNGRTEPPITQRIVNECIKNYFKQTPVRLAKKSGTNLVTCKGKLLQNNGPILE